MKIGKSEIILSFVVENLVELFQMAKNEPEVENWHAGSRKTWLLGRYQSFRATRGNPPSWPTPAILINIVNYKV